jgi:hypothetical protein
MVSLLGALGIVYGSTWFIRQTPKLLTMTTGFLLVREKEKTKHYERMARLGFDIIRDRSVLSNQEDEVEFKVIEFRAGSLHRRLRFLEKEVLFLKEDEIFILDKAMHEIEQGGVIPGDEFTRLISISKERLADEEFMKSFEPKRS